MRIVTFTSEGRGERERCYVICTHGIDTVTGRAGFYLVRRTWIRWTRFTPQTLARALMVPFLGAGIVNNWVTGAFDHHLWESIYLAVSTLFALLLVVIVNRLADATATLNSYGPSVVALVAVGSVLRTRGPYACAVLLFGAFTTGFQPLDVTTWASDVGLFSWIVAYYALTMGRPEAPPKKVRERLVLRLPHLARSSP